MIFFFFQAEDGIRDVAVTGVQTCALPIWAVVQRHLAESARGVARGGAAPLVLGLGRDAAHERERLLPVYAGDESALRPARGARAVGRRRAGARVPASGTSSRRHARGGCGLGVG